MKGRLARIAANAISVLPGNALRCCGYRLLLGYTVRGSRIGFGTVIVVARAELEGCTIGQANRFAGPMTVKIGKGANIGRNNRFTCGRWTLWPENRERGFARSLRIGTDTLITSNHEFDVAGAFELGDGSWIAGSGSQFWTHGANVPDRDVKIGEHCYIGTASRFAPGSGIGDNVIVGIGSVVTKRFDVSNAMIAGVPAKVLKENFDWRSQHEQEIS